MMEPWDGPAAMAFTDGRQIGATLDRNGLRPARYVVTDDDLVVMASESGVLPIPESKIVKKWRLQPGKMFLIDLEQGRIIDDEELKNQFCVGSKPYREWIESVRIKLDEIDAERRHGSRVLRRDAARPPAGLRLHAGGHQVPDDADGAGRRGGDRLDGQRLAAGGAVGQEQAALQLLQAAVRAGHEPADRPDPRELVMSLVSFIGPKPNLLDINRRSTRRCGSRCSQPVLDFEDMARIRHIEHYTDGKFKSYELDICYPLPGASEGIEARWRRWRAGGRRGPEGSQHPDRVRPRVDRDHVAIPALLALSAVHQHLVREGLRTTAGLVVETGSAREVHHFALLAGYGAEAIHPYLAMETLADMHATCPADLTAEKAVKNYIKAIGKGLSR
jgi:glutamate synthase (NADPH/NADH) large chain